MATTNDPTSPVLDSSSLWNFVNWDSLWPLPHVLLAYHAYLYTRNWISVLCFYYLLKTAQLFMFSFLGLHYEHYFAEVLDSRALDDSGGGDGGSVNTVPYLNPQIATSIKMNEPYSGCLIDFNGLFVGGTIQTFLGILLGMTHAYLTAPSIYSNKNFHPVTFWKHSAGKYNDESYIRAKYHVEHHTSHRDIWSRYGIWPWYLWLGYKPTHLKGSYFPGVKNVLNSNSNPHNGDDDHIGYTTLDNTIIRGTPQPPPPQPPPITIITDLNGEDTVYMVYRRWKFRRTFWKRWLQLTMLGTPTLLFYTLETGDKHHIIRSGTILYGLATCSLLLWYRLWNERDYIHTLNKKYNKNNNSNDNYQGQLKKITRGLEKTLLKNMELHYNTHNALYSTWMLTCVALIVFQTIPLSTSFYRVIISTVLIITVSLVLGKLSSVWNQNQT